MSISGTTNLLGVMGFPVTYSLSPIMHNAALQYLGANVIYVAFPVPIADLAAAVSGLKAIRSVLGFNLTIPHKQEIFPYLDAVSPIAQQVGAVNTVKRQDDSWIGTNTDVYGFLLPLEQLDRDWHQKEAIILGSGGAAKAVAIGCHQLGCSAIHLIGRNRDTLQKFQDQMPFPITTHAWTEISPLLSNADLVVNATPIGMDNHPGSPLSPTALQEIPPQGIVYDLIYTPRPTLLLQWASQRGLLTIDGLAMLLHQGAKALEFWLEVPAPIGVMAAALEQTFATKNTEKP